MGQERVYREEGRVIKGNDVPSGMTLGSRTAFHYTNLY